LVDLSVILVRIVRCHSEGCDTKIHAIKAVGYRYVCHVFLGQFWSEEWRECSRAAVCGIL